MISNSDSGSDFIGRKLEMGQLTAALDNVLSGRGQIVMLAREPGIGKTRAANELAAMADTKGFSVLRGWCYEHGGAPALWPWLQCIREYIETLDAGQLRREMGPGAADIAEILPPSLWLTGCPRWSPSSKGFVFTMASSIHMADADGNRVRLLVELPGTQSAPDWFDPAFARTVAAAEKRASHWAALKRSLVSDPH